MHGNSSPFVLIAGAGPAGLTAAHHLVRHNAHALVVERLDKVGGIARTESYKGYRFDIGGHRFFTKVEQINELWDQVLGDDFISVPRLSRIYYQGKFYNYPLSFGNALRNLGIYESSRILLSYFKWQARPKPSEENFEEWVINRFGGRLYAHFFQSYTEKVWGLSCKEIRADWAAQRIKNLSLAKAVWNAFTGGNDTTSLIKEFKYPRLGPGMMWDKFKQDIEDHGGEVRLQSSVETIWLDGNRVERVDIRSGDDVETVAPDHVISSMPLPALLRRLSPAAPAEVLDAAAELKYRDFLIVVLILKDADPFPDNWIYVHSPKVKVGRIQNFRSWSPEMVPDPETCSIGMEYFCRLGDELWDSEDADLIEQAIRELSFLGLGNPDHVVDATVIRQPKAYPVYDEHYRRHVDTISQYVDSLENLQTVGRNGMHRYNNQDHSMLTALLAARNILGESHDLWNVNVERSYHEDFVVERSR